MRSLLDMRPSLYLLADFFCRHVLSAGRGIGQIDRRQKFGVRQIVQFLDAMKNGVSLFYLKLRKFVEDFGNAHGS